MTYTSDVLDANLAIAGPVTAVLCAGSSAPDTDWVVRLCDVWPDGRSMSVCDGILGARYRDSLTSPTLLTPGEGYRFEVDLWSTAQVFKAGHRVRVTSSDFPRYDGNLNTGGPLGTESQSNVAVNTIFHDASSMTRCDPPIWSCRSCHTRRHCSGGVQPGEDDLIDAASGREYRAPMGDGRILYVHPSKLPVDKPCDWSNGASPYLLAPMGIIGLANALRKQGLDAVSYTHLTLPTNREV